ncbi:hypothetical protein C2S52_002611 [Perilla frutescens var. hirtella]|nr:hypothetical protein C2S52_002611 [Perilla frutescens var. hirtella]
MSETTFTLLIHHGGRFNDNMRRRYVGGRVTQVCDDLDIDKVSYPEIMSYVKEDLRYELDSIAGLYYYKIPQGNFVLVQDDRTTLNIVSKLRSRAKLEFFVDHKILEKQVTLHLQTEVIKVGDIQQGVENVVDEADWDSQIDVNLQNNQGSRIMVNDGGDNIMQDGDLFEGKESDYEDDMGDGIIQQNFDNLNVDINFLTDDDEEELQQSRENIRAFKKKIASSMKHNLTNAEDDSRCDDKVDSYGDQIMLNLQDNEVYMAGLESDNDSSGSFYYDSDDNCSYYSETDEECGDHALRRPSTIVCFDQMAVIPVFCCGMIFQNVQECRDALAKYAIMKGLQIHFIKNDQVRVRAGCMEKCPWKFLASKNGHNNNFTVKTYVPNHKCHRKNTNPMATSKYLAKLLRERLMATPFIKYKDLMTLCRTELKLKISMTQARNVREKVIADLIGSYTEEYKRLHDYVQEINASNPAYQFMMRPVRGKILWVNSGKEEIAPPPHKKLPGRPKVNRQKDKHEIQKIGKLSRKGRIMTCKICKQDGHNIRKCPQRMNTVTQGNSRSMKRKNAEINEAIRKNPSAELVNEFMKEKEQVKRGSTSQLQNKASSQVQQAPGQSSSQMQQPISEIMEDRSSKRHIQPNQQGKKSITTAKVRPTKVPTGYGCYVNENTGQTILNPGTRSMKSLYTEPRIMEEHSQYGKKDVPRRENPTSSGLKWKGKAAMTTAQLQVEAQRKIISVTAQAKGRK